MLPTSPVGWSAVNIGTYAIFHFSCCCCCLFGFLSHTIVVVALYRRFLIVVFHCSRLGGSAGNIVQFGRSKFVWAVEVSVTVG